MNTHYNSYPLALIGKEPPLAIKPKPRLPRHQRHDTSQRHDDMAMAYQLSAAAKKMYQTSVELIQKTLSTSIKPEASGTHRGLAKSGKPYTAAIWPAPPTPSSSSQTAQQLLR